MDSVAFILPILFIGGVLFAVYFISKNLLQKVDYQFTELSEDLGLSLYIPKPSLFRKYPELEGTLHNRHFKMYMYIKRYGRSSKIFTTFKLEIDNLAESNLKLFKEQFYHKIGKTFGMVDVQIGNEIIDDQYVIQSYNTAFPKELLSGKLAASLEKAHPRFKGVLELKNNEIIYKEMIQITNHHLKNHFLDMIELTELIANRVEQPFDSHQIGY